MLCFVLVGRQFLVEGFGGGEVEVDAVLMGPLEEGVVESPNVVMRVSALGKIKCLYT